MKKLFLLIVGSFLTTASLSQTHEIGFFAGGSNFIGDIGSTNYIYPNALSGGLVYKYNLNPRIAIRTNYTYMNIKGDDKHANNSYRLSRGFYFSNKIHEFAIGTEFNFFEYNLNELATSFTPYILAQLAIFNYQAPVSYDLATQKLNTKSAYSYTVPLGVGIKGRLGYQFAYALESGVRFTMKDDLDYADNAINNLNFTGNGNDAYVFTGFSIVYTFGRPPCYSFTDNE